MLVRHDHNHPIHGESINTSSIVYVQAPMRGRGGEGLSHCWNNSSPTDVQGSMSKKGDIDDRNQSRIISRKDIEEERYRR